METLNCIDTDEHLFYQAISLLPQPVSIINEQFDILYANSKFLEDFPSAKGSDQQRNLCPILHLDSNQANQVIEQVCQYQKKHSLSHQPSPSQPCFNLNFDLLDNSDHPYIMVTVNKNQKKVYNQAEKKRKDFIQIAAHELRTPLTAIKGFVQLVLERYNARNKKWFFQSTLMLMEEIERDQTFFKVIYDEAIRLDQLTNELLSIFKIDQGKFTIEIEEADFSKIVKESVEEYVIPDDYHQIHYINNSSSLPVMIDIKRIKRVITNLISNAIKYSPNSPDVYVSVERNQDVIRLAVKDKGIGIPDDQKHRIFERFYRAYSPEHENIHGYGIGLHICREIMLQHKGNLWFESTYGEGSTFYIELPCK